MEATRTHGPGRAARRLLVGALVGIGLLAFVGQPAGAATSASFSGGVLTVFGDGAPNTITVSRNAAGAILVNGGAVAVSGGTPTVANVTSIQVFGLGGADTITLDEASGALPSASLFGGGGGDTLTGGSSSDQLFGQPGNDTLLGKGGTDFLFGSSDNDTMTGGDADDQVFGESGDDRMIWNPGDDTDLDEGGSGSDTVEVNGGGGAEVFTTTANGARVRFDRLDPAPFSIDIGTSEFLLLNANGGGDSFSATGNLAALITIGVNGGTGADTILGSNGHDFLSGGDDDDFVDGQQGNDFGLLGGGADVFQWDPGDGSDQITGQGDSDTLLFNGSAANEIYEAAAQGGALRFTRNVGAIVMNVDDVETLHVNVLGGADAVSVADLSATDVDQVEVDQAGTIGGAAGDASADVVTVNGTSGADVVDVLGAGTSSAVLGLSARVDITNTEGASDSLVVNAHAGTDGVTATTLPAGVIKLTVDGGAAGDTLLGSQGADVFLGGDGDDFVFGDNGNDVAFLGADDDTFQWDPGDGNDTVEGQIGADALLFFGSNASENITISPNGGRIIFFRDVANVTMDLDDVETIDYRALGGSDNVQVGDLTGTDVTAVDAALAGPVGGGDGSADTVTVNGTNGADTFGAAGDAAGVDVFGLQAAVAITGQEVANDRLTLNALGGDDVVDATSLEADGIQLTMNGGLGADVFLGSEGNDLVNGGDGDDTALLGAGDDTFVWNPGDDNDVLEGQDGFDTMLFNGANIAENIDIAANGGRVIFFRDVASVVMDLNDVESIDYNALGGADDVVVNDLTGTDVTEVNANLAAFGGGGDAQVDTVTVQGTGGDDVVVLAGDAVGTSVLGLAAQINITGAEAANDRVIVNALAGDDVIEGSALALGAILFTGNGGIGNDILVGGANADTLLGGDDDDVLLGNGGLDILDGGSGDNVVIQ
jgi:Ca2+-binding RTX toxin-like protein